MKKLRIVLINALLIFLIIIAIEISLTIIPNVKNISHLPKETKMSDIIKTVIDSTKTDLKWQYIIFKDFVGHDFREPVIKDNQNPSVIFAGCSFTFGSGLEQEDTVHAQFADYTNRTSYNIGLPGGGVQEILYMLRHNDIFERFSIDKNNVEYVIYIYLEDHQRRIYTNIRPLVPNFKEKNNKLEEYNVNKFIQKSKIKSAVTNMYFEDYLFKYKRAMVWDKQYLYIKEINREIRKKLKNKDKETKFVILVYYEAGNENWEDVRKEGIEVIKLNDIINTENIDEMPYVISDYDPHPSARVWKLVVPKLAERLGIKK